jgi:hypothetical protein
VNGAGPALFGGCSTAGAWQSRDGGPTVTDPGSEARAPATIFTRVAADAELAARRLHIRGTVPGRVPPDP